MHLEEAMLDCLYHELPKGVVYREAEQRPRDVVAFRLMGEVQEGQQAGLRQSKAQGTAAARSSIRGCLTCQPSSASSDEGDSGMLAMAPSSAMDAEFVMILSGPCELPESSLPLHRVARGPHWLSCRASAMLSRYIVQGF